MRALWGTCGLVLAACSTAGGRKGDAGESVPGLVWRDATGAEVVRGESLAYIDEHGWQWYLDQETGRPQNGFMTVYYAGANCTGTRYAYPVRPRIPFRLYSETFYRVRPDDAHSTEVSPLSSRTSDSNCFDSTGSQRLLEITDAMLPDPPIVEPALSFAPPLRLETQ